MNEDKKELIMLKLEAPNLLMAFEQYEEYSKKLKAIKQTLSELIKLIREVEQNEITGVEDRYMAVEMKDDILLNFTTGKQVNKTFNFRLRELRDTEQRINRFVEETERVKKETVIIKRYECPKCGRYSGELRNGKCIYCSTEETKVEVKIVKRFGDD